MPRLPPPAEPHTFWYSPFTEKDPMRISTLVLASLAAFPVSASESAMSMPSERSPVVSEFDTRARAIQNHGAANSALLIDLGPLPAEEKNTEIPARTSKRRQIGIHRALPDEFTGDLVPHLEWVVDADDQHTAAITFTSQGAVSLRIAVQGRASSRCLSSNFRWRRAAARPRLHISRLQHRPSMAAERRRRHADGADHASVHRCPG